MSIEQYYNQLKASFEEASSKVETIQKVISVGGLTLKFNFAGPSLIPTFFNAFNHLESHDAIVGGKKLTIFFWDSKSTNSPPLDKVPWKGEQRHHLGLIESWTDDQFFTLQQPGSDAIYMLNKKKNEAIYWVSEPTVIPYWESDFPLRMIFHWWLIDTPLQPVHAGAVGTEKGGLLLVGKGGSGKSTSTMSCLNSQLKIAGDDYILLDTKSNVAFSLFSLSKLNKRSIQLLNHDNLNPNKLDEPVDDKYRIRLYPAFKDSLIKKIPLIAILLPEVTKAEKTSIEKSNAAQAILALSPTTLFQLPGLREKSFKKMSDFVRQIPSYRLLLGTDNIYLPDLFTGFIESLKVDFHTTNSQDV